MTMYNKSSVVLYCVLRVSCGEVLGDEVCLYNSTPLLSGFHFSRLFSVYFRPTFYN